MNQLENSIGMPLSAEPARGSRIERSLQITLSMARKRLLRMHFESGVGHIGGNLSCLDLLVGLFKEHMYDQDRFVLSKGHAAGALYVALWSSGRLDEEELSSFHRDGTKLAGHPCPGWHRDIVFATGSLGHGLSLAAGQAHAKLLKNELGSVYCLLSDGELDEGSTWEAIHYMAHHKLENLTAIIDLNGLQGFGTTKETLDLGDIGKRFQQLGIQTFEIDGHDRDAFARTLAMPPSGPKVIIARTTKGSGISFMENRMEWHYRPLTQELFDLAMNELDTASEARPNHAE